MKPRFRFRELLCIAFPALMLGGIAWWLGSEGRLAGRLPTISARNIERMAANARRPSLSLQHIEARWLSPRQAALSSYRRSWSGVKQSCVSIFLDASAFWGQARPSDVPRLDVADVVDDKGRSLRTLLTKNQEGYNGNVRCPFFAETGYKGNKQTATNYTISTYIPLDALPPTTRSATFSGVVRWGIARPLPIKFELIPTWMRGYASRLHVKSVSWNPAQKMGGNVEVVCRISSAYKPFVVGADKIASGEAAMDSSGYDSNEYRFSRKDILLAEWSQRVEGSDGRLNSLNILGAYIKNKGEFSFKQITQDLKPSCTLRYANVQDDKITLTYNVNAVPPTFKNPVFCCEIFLIGDGKVSVRCPLVKFSTVSH